MLNVSPSVKLTTCRGSGSPRWNSGRCSSAVDGFWSNSQYFPKGIQMWHFFCRNYLRVVPTMGGNPAISINCCCWLRWRLMMFWRQCSSQPTTVGPVPPIKTSTCRLCRIERIATLTARGAMALDHCGDGRWEETGPPLTRLWQKCPRS